MNQILQSNYPPSGNVQVILLKFKIAITSQLFKILKYVKDRTRHQSTIFKNRLPSSFLSNLNNLNSLQVY